MSATVIAIAISLLFGAVALAALASVAASVLRGMTEGKAILAELAAMKQAEAPFRSPFPALRQRGSVSRPRRSRTATPELRLTCAAA